MIDMINRIVHSMIESASETENEDPVFAHYKIKIRIAWWFRYLYIPLLIFTLKFIRLFNSEAMPNDENLAFWLDKAITFHIEDKKIG